MIFFFILSPFFFMALGLLSGARVIYDDFKDFCIVMFICTIFVFLLVGVVELIEIL